tara:strand:+ start:257 stop:514 length:258 start_codon:yes stop_codon:yes gene_type:complete
MILEFCSSAGIDAILSDIYAYDALNLRYSTASEVQASQIGIDQIIPLKCPHSLNGNQWSEEMKQQFVNDTDNPLPTCSLANTSKG